MTISINVTLDGCVDHQEGIADDETKEQAREEEAARKKQEREAEHARKQQDDRDQLAAAKAQGERGAD